MITFTKMHALGNDFVVIYNTEHNVTTWPITKWADRHCGIGFDQLLVICDYKIFLSIINEKKIPKEKKFEFENNQTSVDFFCRIFNADGSEAEQCGNGLRCVALFLLKYGYTKNNSFKIATIAGIFSANVSNINEINIKMGPPRNIQKDIFLKLKNNQNVGPCTIVSMGNPHVLIKTDRVSDVDVNQMGLQISAHDYFAQGANVGFLQIINSHHIRLRTFERGVGETLACGSNACAAAVASIINGWVNAKVEIEFHNGSVYVIWDGREQDSVELIGPATFVFEGKIVES